MSDAVRAALGGDGIFRITLAGQRSNALEPGILTGLAQALDALAASGAGRALLSGGRQFSTGGDVARFHQAAETAAFGALIGQEPARTGMARFLSRSADGARV